VPGEAPAGGRRPGSGTASGPVGLLSQWLLDQAARA